MRAEEGNHPALHTINEAELRISLQLFRHLPYQAIATSDVQEIHTSHLSKEK